MHDCDACGSPNPRGHKFCGECGRPLVIACPECGTSASPGAKFCGECGTSLSGEAPAVAEPALPVVERRVCSVLFADLVGFTPLSEARDHEDVRSLLSRYFDLARTVVGRYGGVIEKFIGDAVMAVWGTPVASEGDAERAVRAGLELVAAVTELGAGIGAEGLALRCGVVTGEVTASLAAVGEGMVAGDAVNTAARVQSAAAPGTVWVDAPTQRLTAAAVGFADEGEHTLKGKSEAQRLWRVTRVLSGVGGGQRVDGLEAPMLGRDAELRTIKELFHATAERRTPRLVTITGVAGSGKSRLGWEFEKYLDGLASDVLWHRGRCLSYGEGVAFWALAQAVRQRLEIAEEDAGDEAVRKLVAGVAAHLPAPDEQSFVGVRLGRLLGLPHPDDTGAPLGRDELFAGWRLFLERLAEHEPVVLLVEDTQYADEGLLDFVEHVVDWARTAPLYLVLLGRDEVLQRRPSLGVGRHRTALPLAELDGRSMRALVEALVVGAPEPAVTRIVEQAQGNPLFAVETVRSLIDRDVIVPLDGEYRMVGDVGTLTVPDSLHGLLAARLDALGPALRALVADAAVLGTSFPGEALAAVSDVSAADVMLGLAELVRRDVFTVSADPLSPERGSYVFTQGMLRQVAYATMSRRDRRARHLAVAEHLQRVFADGGEEVMEVVAQHYLDALDAVPDDDADALRGAAVACLIRAGERSVRSGAPGNAARSFDRAAELVLPTDPRHAAQLWERALDAHGALGHLDPAVAAGERARSVYDELGDARAAALVGAAIGVCLSRWRRLADALPYLTAAEERFRDEPGPELVAVLAALAANAAGHGRFEEARAVGDEALRLAQAVGVQESVLADLFGTTGLADLCAMRPVQAEVHLGHAVAISRRAGDARQQARNLNNLAGTYLLTDVRRAIATAREAIDVSRRSGERSYLLYAWSTVIEAMLQAGDWGEALRELDETDELTNEPSDDREQVHAILLLMTGDTPRARTLMALPNLRASDDSSDRLYVAWVDAELARAEGDLGDAVDRLATAWSSQIDLASPALGWVWALAFRCACTTGNLEAAHRFVADLDERRRTAYLPPLVQSNHDLARARLAELDEHPSDVVEEAYRAAVANLRAAGSPYHLAHGLLDHAEFVDGRGGDASEQRAEVAQIAERLGAVDLVHRLEAVRTG